MINYSIKYFFSAVLIFVSIFTGCQKNQEAPKTEKMNVIPNIIEKLCFLEDVRNEDTKNYATVDFIDYLKTSDADSLIFATKKIDLPNGYSYVNNKIESEKFEIADTAKIILQTFSFDNDGNFNFNQTVKLTELEDALKNKNDNLFLNSPFKIKLENNKIITLTEIYIP